MTHSEDVLVESFTVVLIVFVYENGFEICFDVQAILGCVPCLSDFDLGCWSATTTSTTTRSLFLDNELVRCAHVRGGLLRLEIVRSGFNRKHDLLWCMLVTHWDNSARERVSREMVLRLDTRGLVTTL